MKTNPSLRIFKFSTLVPLAIAIAAALVTQPVRADDIVNNIVLTENSSTILTATYNGSTSGVSVTFVSADSWDVTFPSSVTFNPISSIAVWVEPENADNENGAGFSFDLPSNEFVVVSEFFHPISGGLANGATANNFGTDTSNGGSISVTFNDNGDTAGVPEAGSTVGLLSLSLIALLGATRLRHFRLA
jgi:hypothetical protein